LAGLFTGNIVLGLGYERVRFIEPVRPGDQLHARAELRTMRRSQSKPHLGILNWDIVVTRGEASVLEVVAINFIKARQSIALDQSDV
jgi:acyl dehydratase